MNLCDLRLRLPFDFPIFQKPFIFDSKSPPEKI